MNELTSTIHEIVNEVVEPLIGDTPVSVQISAAFDRAVLKDEFQAMRLELETIKKETERLIMLIGDTPVSEQINMAINRPEN